MLGDHSVRRGERIIIDPDVGPANAAADRRAARPHRGADLCTGNTETGVPF